MLQKEQNILCIHLNFMHKEGKSLFIHFTLWIKCHTNRFYTFIPCSEKGSKTKSSKGLTKNWTNLALFETPLGPGSWILSANYTDLLNDILEEQRPVLYSHHAFLKDKGLLFKKIQVWKKTFFFRMLVSRAMNISQKNRFFKFCHFLMCLDFHRML